MTASAVPAGWYDDPYGTEAERFHDGSRWTGRTRVADSPAATADRNVYPAAPTAPRRTWQRVLMIAPVVAVAAALAGMPIPLHRPWSLVIAAVATAAIIATVGRLCSYRWTSAVFAFVFPPCGAFIVFELAWRLTLWPYRTWEGPADDGSDWVRVTHPSVAKPLYVRRSYYVNSALGTGS